MQTKILTIHRRGRPPRRPACAAFLSLAMAAFAETGLAADPVEAEPPLAGHSLHGEAFNEGPRQKAYLLEGMGEVAFPVTTTQPEAQAFFNQGVAQLHGFYYFEAERSFRQALALDTNCVMAYWGMAMANINNEKRAREFIKIAADRKAAAGRREQDWIDALAAFYKEGKKDDKARGRDYVRALETLADSDPDDLEAKAFLVLQIWLNERKGLPISSHLAVDALARQVLEATPLHPLHHYRIHLWDNEKAERALDSAARCGPAAPGIAHMWHMPGHIYSKLHRYADAAWQQDASARVDHAQMIRDRILPDQIHNYAHNNEWLIRDLSHIGRVHDAVDLAKNMIELPRHPDYNTLARWDGSTNDTSGSANLIRYDRRNSSAGYGRRRLFEVLQRFELWEELIRLCDTVHLEPTDIAEEQIVRLRALGAACFEVGDLDRGRGQIRALQTMLKRQKAGRYLDADQAEIKAREKKESEADIAKAMADALRAHAKRLETIETALSELKGHEALSRKRIKSAKAHFEKVNDLPKERMAVIQFRLGNRDRALDLAREAVKDSKSQTQPLANLAELLERADRTEEAREAFGQLREIAAHVDLDVPVFHRLAGLARAMDLPEDWRPAPVTAADLGDRPSLETLGPFRWRPYAAPDWVLPDADGKSRGLADYRGRPVVVVFYLGHGCLHCIEQLNAFAPKAPDFKKAGIEMVAISADTAEGLKKTLGAKGADGYPFPLVSDPALEVFKAYRAHDDFENLALHGTFLIDERGLVRWQDISYEPFTEVDFLIGEARRLLAQPPPEVMVAAE